MIINDNWWINSRTLLCSCCFALKFERVGRRFGANVLPEFAGANVFPAFAFEPIIFLSQISQTKHRRKTETRQKKDRRKTEERTGKRHGEGRKETRLRDFRRMVCDIILSYLSSKVSWSFVRMSMKKSSFSLLSSSVIPSSSAVYCSCTYHAFAVMR